MSLARETFSIPKHLPLEFTCRYLTLGFVVVNAHNWATVAPTIHTLFVGTKPTPLTPAGSIADRPKEIPEVLIRQATVTSRYEQDYNPRPLKPSQDLPMPQRVEGSQSSRESSDRSHSTSQSETPHGRPHSPMDSPIQSIATEIGSHTSRPPVPSTCGPKTPLSRPAQTRPPRKLPTPPTHTYSVPPTSPPTYSYSTPLPTAPDQTPHFNAATPLPAPLPPPIDSHYTSPGHSSSPSTGFTPQ